MLPEPTSLLIVLTLLWFVAFWIVGGIIFAVIGLVRFLKLNKNRFSCLFTFFSGVTAFAAAWMGIVTARAGSPRGCAIRESIKDPGVTKLLPNLFECSANDVLAAAGLWFIILLAVGIMLMFVSRTPERPRDIHGNG